MIAAFIAAIIIGLVLGVVFAVVVSHNGKKGHAADGGTTTASGSGGIISTSHTGPNVPVVFTTLPGGQRPASSLPSAQATETVTQETSALSTTTSDPSTHPALLSSPVQHGTTAQETTGPTSTKLDPNPSSETQIPSSTTSVLISGRGKFGYL